MDQISTVELKRTKEQKKNSTKQVLEISRLDKSDWMAWNGLTDECEGSMDDIHIIFDANNNLIKELSEHPHYADTVPSEEIKDVILEKINGPISKVLVVPLSLDYPSDYVTGDNVFENSLTREGGTITVEDFLKNYDEIRNENSNINGFAVWSGEYDKSAPDHRMLDNMNYDLTLVLCVLARWEAGQCYRLTLHKENLNDESLNDIEETFDFLSDSKLDDLMKENCDRLVYDDNDIKWDTYGLHK